MAMGTRERRQRQESLWIAAAELPVTAAHPFYQRLNQLLDEQGFDQFVEALCASFYADRMGRPSLTPGIYFRLLLVGYFEGIDSERGIAWRAADSLGLRRFLSIDMDESTPDHSTISRTRRLISLETHREVFRWALRVLAERGLVKGTTVAVDATTLEANAAMRSVVRRDTGGGVSGISLAVGQGVGHRDADARAIGAPGSQTEETDVKPGVVNPHDPDAKVAKMKDGSTHLAHKAEHAVDLETGAIVAVTLQGADQGDTTTIMETVAQAGEQIAEVAAAVNSEEGGERVNPEGPAEVVTDKGYHSNEVVAGLQQAGVRSYISEPERGPRKWEGKRAAQAAVYANRRRIRGKRGKALLRRRGELVERSFAHVYGTGGMRRTHLRKHENILKRLVIHVSAFNLSLILRRELKVGTPRGLQGRPGDSLLSILGLWKLVERLWRKLGDIRRLPEVASATFPSLRCFLWAA
jgi:transposase